MRRHPVVGTFFLVLGSALLLAGAFARGSPAFLEGLPLPPEVVIPFVLWQLAVWALLFGLFFLRPRGRLPPSRTAPRAF